MGAPELKLAIETHHVLRYFANQVLKNMEMVI